MIKANELRIENIISISGKLQVITQITSQPFRGITTRAFDGHKGYNCSLGDSAIEPIALTEEWLLRFGFDNKHSPVYFKNGIEIILEQGIPRYYIHNPMKWIDVDYVHELQNLYFALTGGELKSQK